MITAGIDIGSRTTEVVLLEDKCRILGSSMIPTKPNSEASAEEAVGLALSDCKLSMKDLSYVVSTGYGRENVSYSDKKITEIACHATGAVFYFPSTRTVIDIGGQDSKVISLSKLTDKGVKVLDFAMNDKCAAGTGRFIEVMADALELDIGKLGSLSEKSKEDLAISSMCTVFAESEVISLIHENYKKEDIIKGLHRSIATKVLTLARRLDIVPECTLTGGVAKNSGIVKEISEKIKMNVNVPDNPQMIGALGAAVLACKQIDATKSVFRG